MHDDEPDDEDWYDEASDVDATIPCPECGAAVYDDPGQCSRCGHWLTDADHRALDRDTYPSRRVRLVALFLLAILIFGLLVSLVTQ